MSLEELASIYDSSLNANDREVLAVILKEERNIRELNSVQLAEYLHISRTTLTRLLHKLGIAHYAEFKLLLSGKKFDEPVAPIALSEIVAGYHSIIDELKEHDYTSICRMIYEARTVYLYGTGNEQKAFIEEFKRVLLLRGKHCITLFDIGEVQAAAPRFQKNDVLIAVSLSGENQEALQIIKAAQAAVHTVSFTRWQNNSLARICQSNIYVSTRTIFSLQSQSYEMVAAFYVLLDILSVRYTETVNKIKEEAVHGNH